jgi:defect-in-organelle-trafficking protein DotC
MERTQKLEKLFDEREDILDGIFDFSAIMKMASSGENQMFFLPPVIQEAKNVMAVSNDSTTVRVSGKLYEVKRPARLTLRPPHWRQYLSMNGDMTPEVPNKALLPRNPLEKQKWALWVNEGWEAGVRQAEEEMRMRIRQLGEDFTGMIRYMRLIDEGKIKAPNISTLKQGVAGGGDNMRENEAIYQLNIPARFDTDVDNWNPFYGEARGALRLPIEPTGK